MPFIDTKVTMKLNDAQRDKLKTEFGKVISLVHKPESYLMCGFTDEYPLYFAGEKLEKGAFVSVDVYGPVDPACGELTREITRILNEELDIPPDKMYIKHLGVSDFGWNGRNF